MTLKKCTSCKDNNNVLTLHRHLDQNKICQSCEHIGANEGTSGCNCVSGKHLVGDTCV